MLFSFDKPHSWSTSGMTLGNKITEKTKLPQTETTKKYGWHSSLM